MNPSVTYSSDIAFTPTVKAVQSRRGSRAAYAEREEDGAWSTAISDDLKSFIEKRMKPLMAAIEAENLDQFNVEFDKMVKSANAYHDHYDKPYLQWKLPSQPPPDLDMTPRRNVK